MESKGFRGGKKGSVVLNARAGGLSGKQVGARCKN